MNGNAVKSTVEYGVEAFPKYMYNYYLQQNASYLPFSTVTSLKQLLVPPITLTPL